jgi:hypothetical protein
MSVKRKLHPIASLTIQIVLVLSLTGAVSARWRVKLTVGQETMGAASSATLTVSLVDPVKNAQEKTATVEVQVAGVQLIDPALTNKQPTKSQGHLNYQVDSGPVVATTTTKHSFHNLTPRKHKIVVMLANNDQSPAGPERTLEITVP